MVAPLYLALGKSTRAREFCHADALSRVRRVSPLFYVQACCPGTQYTSLHMLYVRKTTVCLVSLLVRITIEFFEGIK